MNLSKYLCNMNQANAVIIADALIISKIYLIRGQKVILDRDLAAMYGVETRMLNQAIKRNEKRFPVDFMFRLTRQELSDWRSQNVMSNKERMGMRKPPNAFTEQGVAMLSSVLNSETAIDVNIQIIRIFSKVRQVLTDHAELRMEVEKIKNKLDNQDKNMEIVFKCLDELLEKKNEPLPERKSIGYKITTKK